jgi:outer membrane protein TolC
MMRPLVLILAMAAGNAQDPPQAPIPVLHPLEVPQRIGVLGETKLTLTEVIEKVLANDRDIQVQRILRDEANSNVVAAKGYYDPNIGVRAYKLKSVTAVASSLGGAPDGKLTQNELNIAPTFNGLFPRFGGTYELDVTSSRQTSDNQFLSLNPQYPTNTALKLVQPLWRGLRFDENRYRLQVAIRNRTLSGEQLRQRVIETVTAAINAYWEVDYARSNLDVQIEAVRLAERQFESNRRQAEQGLLAPIDVVAAQTQNATFRQNVFAAQEALTRAENALKQMIAANRDDLLWQTALIPETPAPVNAVAPVLTDAARQALKSRPELAQSDLSIEINRLDSRLRNELAKPRIDAFANVSVAGLSGIPLAQTSNPLTGGFGAFIQRLNDLSTLAGLPAVSVSGLTSSVPPIFVGGYGTSWSNLASGTFPTLQAGVQINFPIRNRTARAAAEVSEAEGRRLKAQREQLEMLIESDVRNSIQALVSARSRLDAASLARASAEEQYQSEQRQFQSGTSTVFLVLQRQTDLIASRTREVRAKAEVAEASAGVGRATGSTLDVRGIALK